MIVAAGSSPSHGLRPRVLASALTASLLASAAFSAVAPLHAATSTDTSWVQFRAQPSQRIFSDLLATRPPAHPSAAAAATWPVSTCDDDGPGSLRAAIAGAGDGDLIDLGALTCSTITLATGAIKVPLNDLTLNGPGRTALAIDGNDLDRVFFHPGHGTLTLNALTVRHGRNRATGFHVAGGGCIASAGYLTLIDATVRDCYAGGEGAYGGAIYAYSLAMSNSTLSGNVALGIHEDAGTAAFGGAAFVYTMQLLDSTVTGNRAEHHDNPGRTSYDIGGGIITVLGGGVTNSTVDSNYSHGRGGGIATFTHVEIANSTLSGNVAATEMGGALFLRWPATLLASNSTVTANRAGGAGGGLWLAMPTSRIDSSIVSGNRAGSGQFADLQSNVALVLDGSHNLIGDSGPSVALPTGTLHIDPLLGPLAHHGGPTRTHALLRGSPAVDAGDNPSHLPDDQRGAGYPRVFGAAADIGAFEQQAPRAAAVDAPVPGLGPLGAAALALLLGLVSAQRLRARRVSGS